MNILIEGITSQTKIQQGGMRVLIQRGQDVYTPLTSADYWQVRNFIHQLECALISSQQACTHVVPEQEPNPKYGDYGSAICEICRMDLGWYCPSNPKKYCEYNYATHGEDCIHCGEPDERK